MSERIPRVLTGLGVVARPRGDDAQAETLFAGCLSVAQEQGLPGWTTLAHVNLGDVARDRGDTGQGQAVDLYHRGLVLARQASSPGDVAYALEGRATAGQDLGEPGRAARLYGMAGAMRAEIGSSLSPLERAGHDRRLAAIHAWLGEGAMAARGAGHALAMAQAVEEAATASSPSFL